ncbi:MAG: RNA polymerase sigma factor [Armatimonadetes bacterium]|nr:RNA polymerase sigma factor [Armatimonadota bacterium]
MLRKERFWVQALLKGDTAAGDWFVRAHYPRIYRLLYHLSRNPDTAQDLTQQTFVKAWQAVASFRNHSLIRTWLHRIAWNEYLHWQRDKKECTSLSLLGELPDTEQSDILLSLDIANALSQLSEEHRGAFILYHVQDLSIAEVAEIIGVPPGTVKSRLFTARQHLRQLLRDENPRITLNTAPLSLSIMPESTEVNHEEVRTQPH